MGQSPSVPVMGQSPSVSVMDQSPWVHEMEQSAWDHEMGQSPWVSEIDQSPWVLEMEQSPRVHEMEQSHWVHEMEQSHWIPKMEQSIWVPMMEQISLIFEDFAYQNEHEDEDEDQDEQEKGFAEQDEHEDQDDDDEVAPPMPMLKLDDDDDDEPYSTSAPPEMMGRLDREGGHFKVPHRLRQVNQAAYEPELISIGPFHHNKEHLRDMEEVKKRFLQQKGKETRDRCFKAVKGIEKKARNWYGTSVVSKISSRAFVDMMVVDGCFIIELLCNEPKDPIEVMNWSQIATTRWSRLALYVDLLLLENQLPFFVLVELYGLIKHPRDETDFASKAFAKLIKVMPVLSTTRTENPSTIKYTEKTDHLLGLVHDNWLPSPRGTYPPEESRGERPQKQVERHSIRCAIELAEAGIEFKAVDRNKESEEMSLFDVNFTDGKMKIPTFVIDDNTERLFRNLIAYELFVQGLTYVIDYAKLMDNLVNTANDVKLLRLSGVIQNMLGDDEAVAQMLNKLLDNVTLSGDTFIYQEIFVNVQKHCERRWNTWKAKLRHDYFSNPWARIAFVAGLLVFLTTITTFILSFFTKK